MFKSYFPRGMGILITAGLLSLAGCSSPEASVSPPDLRGLLAGLKLPPNLQTGASFPMVDTPDGEVISQPNESGQVDGVPVSYQVTTQKYKASASYDTQVLLNPSTDVIYPGSVLLGHTIDDGSFQEVTMGTKRPVAISFDLTGVKGGDGKAGIVGGTIVPTLDAYRNLRNTILTQTIPKQTSSYSYEITEVNDQSEFDLKLTAGAKFSGGFAKATIQAGFDFSTSNTKRKVMVRFMQTFYTVDISQGNGTFLYSDFDLGAFKGYRPVYVSSVSYGRLAFLTIESNADMSTIKANLEMAFKAATVSGNLAVEAAASFLKTQTKTNITVIGGTTVALDIDSFMAMLADDTFSETNAGKIVAYKLRFVDDNAVANTIFNGEYVNRSVQMVAGKGYQVGLKVTKVNCQVLDGGGNADLYGSVTYSNGSQTLDLWKYAAGATYRCPQSSLNDYNGPVQNLTLPSASSTLTINIPYFREEDTFADDAFNPVTQTYAVSALQTGKELKITTNYSGGAGEWVEFTIVPTVTPLP